MYDKCVKYVNVSTNVTLLTGIELYANLWGKNIPFKDFYLNHYCHDNVVIVCALIKTPQQIFTDIFFERNVCKWLMAIYFVTKGSCGIHLQLLRFIILSNEADSVYCNHRFDWLEMMKININFDGTKLCVECNQASFLFHPKQFCSFVMCKCVR